MMQNPSSSHEKWGLLSSEDIHKYLDKYTPLNAVGKCSSRRRKKIKFLQKTIHRREKALRLISGEPC